MLEKLYQHLDSERARVSFTLDNELYLIKLQAWTFCQEEKSSQMKSGALFESQKKSSF